ncbi:MAG: hypothetical protein Fur0020_04660 [Thermodesulfovibrionia bacterium]
MMRSIGIGKEPRLQRLVIISALLHLILITFTLIPLKTGRREYKSYYVNLVGPIEISRGSIRTQDGIGIVKKGNQKDTTPDNTIDSKKTEEITREIERLRAIRELSRRRQGKKEEIEIIKKRMDEEATGAIVAGRNGEGIDPNSYYAIVSEMIWSKWIYPDIKSSGLEAIISIRIDDKGNIISHEIEKTSGNPLFDQSVLRAISKANPLPPPPMGIETEIGVRFRL